MNIQYAEYIGLFAQDVGVRVSVHPYNVTPFPENDGVNAPPAMMTQIGVKLVTMDEIYNNNNNDNNNNTACNRVYNSINVYYKYDNVSTVQCVKSTNSKS